MSQAQIMLVRHLSGFLAALEAFVTEMKPQMEQLKAQLEKEKHS